MFVAPVSRAALVAHRYSGPGGTTTTRFAIRWHPALSISTSSARISSPAILPVPRGPMVLRSTRRPFRSIPDSAVCLSSHPHLYLSTVPIQLLDTAHRQALPSAIASEYGADRSDFLNAHVHNATLRRPLHVEETLALASTPGARCSTPGSDGFIPTVAGTWKTRRRVRHSRPRFQLSWFPGCA